ncbi:cytochrome [Candidatus Pacearchaeota archaeon]|nr:hypothetical protein [uncultured archaeon]MBS3066525.1 cytochrome [Candidatus Pacearchaeota archaeon]
MRKTIIGVMGPGKGATEEDIRNAMEIGMLIAENEWILLSGGRKRGVMGAVNEGAKSKNGLTLGILPDDDESQISDNVDIAIFSNMHSGRNYINVLSSDVVIACGINSGTSSEISLALSADKNVILLNNNESSKEFFKSIGEGLIHIVHTPKEAIEKTKEILNSK